MNDTAARNIEHVRLNSEDKVNELVRAQLFGEMLKRAAPVVQHYRSDLFHDANWLTKYVTGELTFQWMIRPCGTHIGEDLQPVIDAGPESGAVLFHVTLSKERFLWIATFEQVSFR